MISKKQIFSSYLGIAVRPSMWLRWWNAWGTRPVWSWIFAASAFRDGDFRTAAFWYEKGLLVAPQHVAAPSARFDYAYCLHRLGQHRRACEELSHITNGSCEIVEASLLHAEILSTLGEKREAVALLQSARIRFPKNVRVAVCLLVAALEAKQHLAELLEMRDALLVFRGKLDLEDPVIAHINTALAQFELMHGSAEMGQRLLARVIAGGNCSVEAVILRARWLLQTNNIAQARRLASRAIEAAPRQARPYAVLAQCLLAGGALREHLWAVQLAQTACALSSYENVDYLEILHTAYSASGDSESAEIIAERARVSKLSAQLDVNGLDALETQFSKLQELQFSPQDELV